MNQIIMLPLDAAKDIRTGVYKTGPNAGKDYSIALGRFAGPGGRVVSRIIPNVDVAKAFAGSKLNGTIVEAKTQSYSFQNTKGEKVSADTKWVVQFEGESLEAAIKAHGKKPALQLAAAPLVMQASADVCLSLQLAQCCPRLAMDRGS